MFAWVLVGLAALTIDLGLVRATQRQMQSMTDEAALEAAHQLDGTPTDRQLAAQSVINAAMNDTQSNEDQRFGAGPTITLAAGSKDLGDAFSAPSMLTNPSKDDPSRKVYKPELAANAANAPDGDIVRGTFTGSTKAFPEAADYSRDDFTLDSAGNAILVRLRRSHESFTDGDTAKTAGPALPYLFARGSLMSVEGKAKGVTIRATSIAAARPVLTAGPSIDAGHPGVAPFGLTLASWQTWRKSNPTATTLTATVDGTGAISGDVAGAFTSPAATDVTMIGKPFIPSGAAGMVLPFDRYVPLFDAIGGIDRIVGFINTSSITLADGTLTLSITTAVATANATTALSPGAAASPLTGLSAADLIALFTSNANIIDPLRAPTLVR
jgi:Flp pilus assembly protein TadG